MSTLGDRLRIARDRKGLTQVQVRDRTNINNKTLSGYEKNVSEPDSKTLGVLADLYGVSYKWLLTGKGNIEEHFPLNEKEERDVAKRMERLRKDLMEGSAEGDGLNFRGEPMSPEAIESLLAALEHAERMATLANRKFIPKKHRKEE